MRKNILIFIIIIVLFGSLGLSGFLFYNQNRVAAQEAIVCEQEIPIGEAMEEAAELLGNSLRELQSANYQISKEIEAAEEMINLAEQCDIQKCNPVCSPEPIKPGYQCNPKTVPVPCPPPASSFHNPSSSVLLTQSATAATCFETIWSTCYSVNCREEECSGQVCPNEQIGDEFNKIETAFNQIKGVSKRIENIFESKKTIIGEKLYEARNEFDDCAFSPSDWIAAEKGEKTPIFSLSCVTVLEENFQRENEECKSLYNFFCCR